MVFQHSGARDFDLGGGFHYSCSYPMVFQHSAAEFAILAFSLPSRRAVDYPLMKPRFAFL
jgi:hypothetical protein